MLDAVLRPWIRVAESGWRFLDATMKVGQSITEALGDGSAPKGSHLPPYNGSPKVAEATADFANRLAVVAASNPIGAEWFLNSWNDVWDAASKSFAGIERRSLRQWMALSMQLPLSAGTLVSLFGLRTLHGAYVVGLEKLPDLIAFATEIWIDAELYTSLQYKTYVARLAGQVRQSPEDARLRLQLGHTYIKLGRFLEARSELAQAMRDSRLRAEALQESMVANYYAADYAQAVADGAAAMALKPLNKTRYWLWLAAQKAGGYPEEVPPASRMEVRVGRHPTQVRLENVAAQLGLNKTSAGRGTAVFDMDGDGYLDVVIASNHAGISLYRNNGDGTFTDASVGSGLEYCYDSFAIAVGDYNNDGWDDLYVTRQGFYPGESVLFRNNGDGTFTDVTRQAGVQSWGTAFCAQWVDYDRDGRLDLFVTRNQGRLADPGVPNRLFHNNGDGTFTDVTNEAGLSSVSPTIGCAWGDYDNDGYPDLFLSSGLGRAQLYHNNGDGTFTDVSRQAGIDEISLGFIALWCDYDNDGWLDLIQFVWSPEEDVLHTLIHGQRPANGHPLKLYHNNRDGTFTLVSQELGLDECWGTMCANVGDYNNDGWLDILLGNGAPPMDRTEPPILYEFQADGCGTGRRPGKFHNVSFAAGLPYTGKGHGANFADLAGDGRLCLIVADGGMYPGDLLTTLVCRPTTLPGNYLNVRLVGTRSNRNAIGARLKLKAGGRCQHRAVDGGSGFGCLPFEQHFGLGTFERIEALEILWPSGLKQQFRNLPVNNTIRITEGKSAWDEVYPRSQATRLAQKSDPEPAPELSAV
ncbi:MAG TPA: FG-GAP-like repeat-containing protein [Terriglobia bacterium]|nr:FG-GAP-like repeat-containing protein [Terriglobia bacterium]